MSNEFKKYTSGYGIVFKFLIGLFAFYIVFFAVILRDSSIDVVLSAMSFPIIGILLTIIITKMLNKRFLKKIEDSGCADLIYSDFSTATSMRKDLVRFGNTWIFIKNKRKILKYDEITRVYQYIKRVNFVENERALKYVDSNGKHRVLCSLQLRGKSDEELNMMIALILSNNRNVAIGYL